MIAPLAQFIDWLADSIGSNAAALSKYMSALIFCVDSFGGFGFIQT